MDGEGEGRPVSDHDGELGTGRSGEYVAGPGLVMSRGLRRRLAAHSMSARLPCVASTAHWPRSRPPLEGRRAGRTKPWRTTASPLRATVSTGVGGVAAISNREGAGRPVASERRFDAPRSTVERFLQVQQIGGFS